ncbi:carboxylesterase family protein [Catellatospora sp. TT07R-123]|uniref:carboxylesterase family protein n=1 Tax=Catellatospora sp. TT07R-123 TaxID=2733863 RepID=UPI0024562223|nr:carboxylesterase family protein [Catellatospora sp. TT07R-123]
MLDQVAALQWVRGNIRMFGGDPDRITASGGPQAAVRSPRCPPCRMPPGDRAERAGHVLLPLQLSGL